MEQYLLEIDRTPLLSADDEKRLGRLVQAGDSEARDHLIRANLRLVVNTAKEFATSALPFEDLVAEGNIGLIRAAESFDPDMNTRFSTYAIYWIRQAMRRGASNTGKTVRIPAYLTDLLVKWRAASSTLQAKLGRAASFDETVRALNLSEDRAALVRQALDICGTGLAVEQTEPPPVVEPTSDVVASRAAPRAIHDGLYVAAQQDERAALVLRMRFGIDGGEPMTLREIADKLGTSRELIRNIESRGLALMAAALADLPDVPRADR